MFDLNFTGSRHLVEYGGYLRHLAAFVTADHAREQLLTLAAEYEALAEHLEQVAASVSAPDGKSPMLH